MFSKRNGYISEKIIQLESLDEDARKSIWNIFYLLTKGGDSSSHLVARKISCSKYGFNLSQQEFEENNHKIKTYNVYDETQYNLVIFRKQLKEFIYTSEWNRVFDIIELFIEANVEINSFSIDDLTHYFNGIFESESVGYKITNEGKIIKITNEEEFKEINDTQSLPALSKKHFENAINEFSKRKDVNYKLVARESIDGIEALLRDILGDEKIILGKAINKIQIDQKYLKYNLFFDGLDKIWAFANDRLRHAEKSEESIIGFHDAKFILVLASSIANYINSIK